MQDINTLMKSATEAFNRGQFGQARDLAAKALQRFPNNPQILQFLGIAQSQAGDTSKGLATLEHALKLAPHDQNLRYNLAKAAMDAGRPEVVEKVCDPNERDPRSLRLRADAAKLRGDKDKAILLYRKLRALSPNDGQVLNNLGNLLLDTDNVDDAVEALRRASDLLPQEPQIWLNLGRARSMAGYFEDAEKAFDRAVSLNPTDAQTNFELGKSLSRHGQAEKALARLAHAAREGIRDPQIFVLIGLSFAALDQRERAEDAYRMALHVDGAYGRAYLALAIMYEQGNRIDDLLALQEQAREVGVGEDERDYIDALVLRRQGDLEGALEKAQGATPESLDSVVRAQFIGQVADRLGQYDVAFEAFAAMNNGMAAQPDARRFDGTEHRKYIERRSDFLTDGWRSRWNTRPTPDDRRSPAFLGGFLRSGTTLLDTILMGHAATDVREEEGMVARLEAAGGAFDELPGATEAHVMSMRDAYFEELQRGATVQPNKLVIDKYPLMTLRAAYIHRAFPDAKFIFALRHPCDVVLSCYMQNFRVTQAMASFLSLENAAKLYAVAMDHWERCREVLPLRVHTVRYEDMVQDLEGQLRPLMAFLDLEWDDALLDHQRTARERGYIRTPSYAQVTEQVYTRSSGRWEAYRKHMEPVLPVLEPWIERFGYEMG